MTTATSLAQDAVEERVVEIESRPGVRLRFLEVAAPRPPDAVLLLFVGGGGGLGLGRRSEWDNEPENQNFLKRSRRLFAARGFQVILPDVPSDRRGRGLFGWRRSADHMDDIASLAAHLRRRNPDRPLWLVGTSRGAISAAAAAARPIPEVTGIVLTASVTQGSRKHPASLAEVELARVTLPVLLLHHARDACKVSPAAGAEALLHRLNAAEPLAFRLVEGGSAGAGNPCRGGSYHGFLDLEDDVVEIISDWIRTPSSDP